MTDIGIRRDEGHAYGVEIAAEMIARLEAGEAGTVAGPLAFATIAGRAVQLEAEGWSRASVLAWVEGAEAAFTARIGAEQELLKLAPAGAGRSH